MAIPDGPAANESGSNEEVARQAKLFRQQVAAGEFSHSLDPFDLDDSRLDTVLQFFQQRTRDVSATQAVGEEEDPEEHQPPARIGRFAIERKIGVGGFSTVYLAHDDVLLRDVALKSIRRRGRKANGKQDEKRLHEARAAARLSHPNLVPLYEVFQDEQADYLVSELCLGSTLADWLTAHPGPIDPQMTCATCVELTEAIIHVHDQGLVHRDIKPGNIMISESVGGDGRLKLTPRLTDFGLVRDIFAESELVAPYRLVGTLLYMSPEQVLENESGHGKACDIFAIGVLLYRMLTGCLPHRGDKPVELFNAICIFPPTPPRELVASIPRDLEAICLKCLAKDPAQRYQSAVDLRDDLHRWQHGMMVTARPRPFAERTWNAIRRSPLESSLLATIILLLIAGTLVLGHSNRRLTEHQSMLETALEEVRASEHRAIDARQRFREQRDLAITAEQHAMKTAYVSDLRHAYEALSHNNLAGALQIAESIADYAAGIVPIGIDLRLLQTQARKGWTRLPAYTSPIREVLFLPNGKQFAVAGEEGPIRIHDIESGEIERELPTPASTRQFSIAASPDGRLLAVGIQIKQEGSWLKALNQIEFYSLDDTPAPDRLTGLPTTVESLAFSPDGDRLAVGCRYQPIRIVDYRAGTMVAEVAADQRNEDLEFSADGNQVTMLFDHYTVRWSDWRGGDVIQEVETDLMYDRLAWSGNGGWVVCCPSHQQPLDLIDLRTTPNRRIRLQHNEGISRCVAISHDGRRIVAGTQNGAIVRWDLSDLPQDYASEAQSPLNWPNSGKQILHTAMVTEIAFESHGTIASGGEDGSLVISQFEPPPPENLREFQFRPMCVAMEPNGQSVYVALDDCSIVKVETTTSDIVTIGPPSQPRSRETVPEMIRLSDDGRWVANGNFRGDLSVFDLHRGNRRYVVNNPDYVEGGVNYPTAIDFGSGNDRVVFSTAGGNVLGIYELPIESSLKEGEKLKPLFEQQLPVSHRAAVLRDDKHYLMFGDSISQFTFGQDDIIVGERGMTRFHAACVAHQTGAIYTVAADNRVRQHDAHGQVVQTSARWPPPPGGLTSQFEISSIVATPDGKSVLTGGSDGSIGIWDADDLRYLGFVVVGTGKETITEIQFSDDGRYWVYLVNNNKVRPTTFPFSIETIENLDAAER
ncbi:WD40 repeat domain-containing serine/threonine protein kinase [Rosistilla oblonga]|uniref:WD40 repeat domain-containing serine/threonine protein kinase n=1 Tax=Rosistilla oblonga TaxID=2527990 RepID=UPI003A96B5E4